MDILFLLAQGFKVQENIVFQDNKTGILMEKKGSLSSSQRTRHIKIRYFFIKDLVEPGEMQIEYCPTNDMIADFSQNPYKEKSSISLEILYKDSMMLISSRVLEHMAKNRRIQSI